MRSVSWPPSSCPTYPGGEPMSFETACFSMYSDMSNRTSAFWWLKRNSASWRAASVLPTPERRHRNAGPARDDLVDVRARHLDRRPVFERGRLRALDLFLDLDLALAKEDRALEVLLRDGLLHLPVSYT